MANMFKDDDDKIVTANFSDLTGEDGDFDDEMEEFLDTPDLMDVALISISKELEVSNILKYFDLKYGGIDEESVKEFTDKEKELVDILYDSIVENCSLTKDDENDDED